METKANYVTVGIFTLVAILAAFGFVYWSAAIGDRGETATLRVRIQGSASGLGRGSAVLFNGVKVGDITRVFIDVQNPKNAIADTTIDRYTPVTQSTQADIGLAGLTGQANIELTGGNLKEPNLLDEAEAQGKIAEITANPSAVTNLLATAQDIFERADSVISNLEGFVKESRDPLERTAQNAATFSNALARNAEGIDKFLNSVSQLSDEVAGVSGRLDQTLASAQGLLDAVDRAKVQNVVNNAEAFSADLRRTGERLDSIGAKVDSVVASADTIVKSLNDTATTINGVAKQSQGTLGRVDNILAGVDPATIRSALSNIEETSRSASAAAANIRDLSQKANPIFDNVGRIAQTFGNRADEIDLLIADVGVLAGTLNRASTGIGPLIGKADGAIAKADAILGGVDPAKVASAVDNIEGASRAVNGVAGTIRDVSRDAAEIAADVNKVTSKFGNRADEIDLLIADAGALAGRLNDASARVDPLLGKADGAIAKVDAILGTVDPAKVGSAVDNIEEASRTVNGAAGTIRDVSQSASEIAADVGKVTKKFGNRADEIDLLIADAGALAGHLNDASARLGPVVEKVDGVLDAVDPNAVRSSIANIQQATTTANSAITMFQDVAQTANNVANDVNRVTQRVAGRTDTIDQFVTDAGQLTGRLNAASVRVDGILQKVDGILGSDQANGLVVEAGDTLRAFRRVADTLNGRIGAIADGLTRFSNQGLTDVRALVQDSQRAVNRIEQAVSDIERNPQRLLSGGEGEVRRFNGRSRR